MKVKRIFLIVLSCLMIALSALPAMAATENGAYSDVSNDFWGYNGIMWATENGLMNGVDNGIFAPDKPMTRAMLVTVLYRFEGEPAVAGGTPFKDLSGSWYMSAVAWAYENEIVNGVSKDSFKPDDPITREQIAAVFYRFSGYKGYDITYDEADFMFPDVGDIHSYAAEAMKWAFSQRLITGMVKDNSNILNPTGNASRAQVATILYRFGMSVDPESPYRLLADYVKENGEETDEGYILGFTYEDNPMLFYICSYENGKDFEIISSVKNEDGTDILSSLFFSVGSSRQDAAISLEIEGAPYYFSGSILASSFSNENMHVSLYEDYSVKHNEAGLNEVVKATLGSCSDALLKLFGVMLNEFNINVTLPMLGFINY